jgi:hypothetical protein
MDLGQLNPAMLREYVGSNFEVLDDPENVFSLILTGVVEVSKTEHSEAFSLFFHGPSDPFLPQGIHRLKHAKLGDIDIFLVPTGKDQDGFQYEAAFNHLV